MQTRLFIFTANNNIQSDYYIITNQNRHEYLIDVRASITLFFCISFALSYIFCCGWRPKVAEHRSRECMLADMDVGTGGH